MVEQQLHRLLVWAVIAAAALTFPYLLRKPAPYGRHYGGSGWGPDLHSSLAWFIMEVPTTAVFLAVYVSGSAAGQIVPILFVIMWQAHYLNRTVLFPLRLRESRRRMPMLVVCPGFLFNTVNAYLNARFVSEFGRYDMQWLGDPRFVIGVAVFIAGMALNLHADAILLRLRRPGESAYAVPYAGAFRYVSCPNYLGELLEWVGWALATWSPSGLAFCLFTAANLIPRALSNHRWYRATFADYPARRRALIPGVL